MSASGNSLTWIVVVAVVAVLAVSALLFLNKPEPDVAPMSRVEKDTESSVPTSETDNPTPPSQEKPSDPAPEEASGEGRETITPEGLYFSGRVIDDTTEEPIRKFRFSLVRTERLQQKMVSVVEDDFEDDEGQFSIPLEKGGSHSLFVWADNYREKRILDLEIPSNLGLRNYEVRMATPLAVIGRVVDDATDLPVEGATVGALLTFMSVETEYGTWGFGKGNKTETDGRFVLKIPGRKHVYVVALHPEYAEGFCETTVGKEEVEIRLKKSSLYVFGTVFDDDGEPAKGIEICFKGETLPWALATRSDEKGAYKSPWLLPGELELIAFPLDSTKDDSAEITREAKWVSLVNRPLEVNFGPSPEYSAWIGTLYDVTGQPVAGGSVTIQSEETIEGTTSPLLHRWTKCDESGFFKLNKLFQGSYRVRASIPDKDIRKSALCDYMVFDKPGVVEKDIHLSGAVVEGVVINGETGKPMGGGGASVRALPKSDTGRYQSASIGRDGRFCLVNLSSGSYTLMAKSGRPKTNYSGRVDDFRVVGGQMINDVRIVLECNGYLVFKITDVSDPDTLKFRVTMQHLETNRSYDMGNKFRITERSYRFLREPGNWLLKVESDDLGLAEFQFAIEPDAETTVVVCGADFKK